MLAPKRDITQGKMTIALIESAFSGPFSPAVRASPRQEMSRIRDSVAVAPVRIPSADGYLLREADQFSVPAAA